MSLRPAFPNPVNEVAVRERCIDIWAGRTPSAATVSRL
jgi:hypothetical protein